MEYLYSANSFSLATLSDHLQTIDYLSYYFLPQRLLQIRSLHIDWKIDSLSYHPLFGPADINLEPWVKSWKIVAQMTGLRRLHVKIGYVSDYWGERLDAIWDEIGAKMLEVVKLITAPKDFVVVLPLRQIVVDADVEDSHLPSGQVVTDIDVGDSHCVLRQREDGPPAELGEYF